MSSNRANLIFEYVSGKKTKGCCKTWLGKTDGRGMLALNNGVFTLTDSDSQHRFWCLQWCYADVFILYRDRDKHWYLMNPFFQCRPRSVWMYHKAGSNSAVCCFRGRGSVTREIRCRISPSFASSTDSSSETRRRKQSKKVRNFCANLHQIVVLWRLRSAISLFRSSRELYRPSLDDFSKPSHVTEIHPCVSL